jgi:hypothetical protein
MAAVAGGGAAAGAAAAKSSATIATNAALISAAALSAAGTAYAAKASSDAAKAGALGSEFQAEQMAAAAGQERAVAQRHAQEEFRRKRIAQSRLQAASAASGASAADPTVTGIDLDLEEEGLYRANLALYEGEEKARNLETGAMVQNFEADQFRRAAKARTQAGAIDTFSTLLGGFGKVGLNAKYG